MEMAMEDSSSHALFSMARAIITEAGRNPRFPAYRIRKIGTDIFELKFEHLSFLIGEILMAGRWELGLPRTTSCSLREQAAKTILRNVRLQGHTYVDLREDGKRLIFFCTLCLAPCYSDCVLFDHLKGTLHNERLRGAKVTLLGPNPWPFNDGVLFFNNSVEIDKQLTMSSDDQKNRLLEHHNDDSNLAIIKYCENSKSNSDSDIRSSGHKVLDVVRNKSNKDFTFDKSMNINGHNCALVIHGVLVRDEVSDIEVRELGLGRISARFLEKDEVYCGISRIWCEWIGAMDLDLEGTHNIPTHDFALVTFIYDVDLGRKGLFDDVKLLLSSSPTADSENGEGPLKKRKKIFSDPEDISDSLSSQYDSSGEDTLASNSSASRLLLDRYDDQLLQARFISNKTVRRELRRQQRLAAERMCGICQHKILPNKDVATLINTKTGRLACSSRNVNGFFHVFHISCLIHWILLCENEIITKGSNCSKMRRRSRKKNGAKGNNKGKDADTNGLKTQIDCVFCPECQGTGVDIEGDDLEKPSILLSEMFKYKIKLSDARRAWMKSPEVLQNCSTGFHFPHQNEMAIQEKVKPLKMLQIYEAPEYKL